MTYKGNSKVDMPKTQQKDGFIFSGWFFDNNTFFIEFVEDSLSSKKQNDNLVVYAKWVEQDSKLTKELKGIYSLAVESNSFEGTYEEWLETVRGPQGIPGEVGLDGNDGKTPYIGENGNWWINNVDSGVFAGHNNTSIPQTGVFEFAVNSDGEIICIIKVHW